MEILYLILFALALGLSIYLAFKYKVSLTQVASLDDILMLMKFVNKQFNYAQQDDLERVLDYCVGLSNYLKKYVEKNDYTYYELYRAIISDAKDFCKEEGIKLDDEMLQIIDMVADYIIRIWFGVE